jgi:hypothetical protein
MTALNVDISNTTVPIHTGFVASQRKCSWSHFSIGAGKYHDYIMYVQSFQKNIKSQNLYFWILLRFLLSG